MCTREIIKGIIRISRTINSKLKIDNKLLTISKQHRVNHNNPLNNKDNPQVVKRRVWINLTKAGAKEHKTITVLNSNEVVAADLEVAEVAVVVEEGDVCYLVFLDHNLIRHFG